jgi:hypothetical protein
VCFFVIKRSFKILAEVATIIVVGITVLAAFATVRLSMGPMSLDILTPYVERGLNAEGGNFKVTLGGTVLAWSQADRDLDIVVKNVRVTNRQGTEQAFVPEIAIGLSIRALIGGEFRPTRFEFFGPRLKLIRGEDGRIDFGDPSMQRSVPTTGESAARDSKDGRDVPIGGEITSTVLGSLLTRPPPGHPLHYLKSISLTDAALEFEDLRNNFHLTSPASNLVLVRDKDGVAVSAHLSLTADGITAPLQITGGYRAATEKIEMVAHFKNLALARLAKLAEVLAPLAAVRFPADGKLGLTMDADGEIDTIVLEATAGAGKLALKGLYAKPIEVRAMHIKARVEDGLKRFKLDHLTADLGGPKIGISGQAVRKGKQTTVALDVTARDVTIPDLKRLWPKAVAPNAREWVNENVDQGKVGRADTRVEFTLAHGSEGKPGGIDVRRIDGGFDFAGLTIHFLKPLPPIKGLTGRAKLRKDAIIFEGGSARVQGLRLDNGKVQITGLDQESGELLKVEAVARGPLPAALALLGHPRLDLLKGFGVNPSEVSGDMAARLAIELPLLKVVTFDMVEVVAAANLKDVKLPKVALDADVTDGDLTLQVDKKGMDVKGSIRLGGVPARLAWTEHFYSGARFRGRYGVKGLIDDAGRKALGLSSEPHVTGPLAFDLVITRFDDKRTGISGTLDVKQAALVFNEIEWTKKPGIGGFARFSLNLENDKIRHIPELSVKAGDLDALGSVRLAADGITVESFKFSKLVFGESDIGVSGQARQDGGLDLSVTGAMIDVRPFLESRRKEGVKRPLSIKADVAEARVGPGPTISSVLGSLSRRTGDWQNMNIRGTVGKNRKPVLLLITPGKDMRNLTITSNDAGATLRSMNINGDMIGGRLTITGKYDDTKPGAPLTGMFRVKKFQMVRAPLMAKVLGVLSLGGVLDALSGKGIAFDELEAPFTKTGDDLRLKNARAYGGALGFTAKGWVDLETDELDIKGTVVPAYTFNKLLGYIPLLGGLLVGEKGSGVFAATYRMKGPLANPEVSTNPLATLTPGFLRGLFSIFDSPSKKPPPGEEKSPTAPSKTYEPIPRPSE